MGTLGFDIGGQSVKAVLAASDGVVLASESAPTGEAMRGEDLAVVLQELRTVLEGRGGPADATTIGVGFAGALARNGVVRGSPHLPKLVGTRVAQTLSDRLGAAVLVHNDADCAAMAEGWHGAVDGCPDFLLIAIGTGVGSGLVLGGALRAGASGYGCELGHMTVLHGGRRCGCGNRGCLEAYISETAARGLVADAPPALRDRVDAHRRQAPGGFAQAIFDLGAGGDADAERLAGAMVEMLGAAIGSVVNVLDLTTIVLGGGIAPAVLARVAGLRQAAAATLFARPESDLTIVAASRGPLAGAIGAARLAMLAR